MRIVAPKPVNSKDCRIVASFEKKVMVAFYEKKVMAAFYGVPGAPCCDSIVPSDMSLRLTSSTEKRKTCRKPVI
jgi:hypothetical protein